MIQHALRVAALGAGLLAAGLASARAGSLFSGYLAEGTATGGSFVEQSGGGYARQPIALGSLANGSALSVTGETFGPATNGSWGTVSQQALYDAPVGGNLIAWWPLTQTMSVASGATHTVQPGAVGLTLPDLASVASGSPLAVQQWLAGSTLGSSAQGTPVTTGVAVSLAAGQLQAQQPVMAQDASNALQPNTLTNLGIARLQVTQRPPAASDDSTGPICTVGANWLFGWRVWQAVSCNPGAARWVQQASPLLPLDSISTASKVAYATFKMRAGYTGYALQLTRASDSTTVNVGFLSDGSLDAATADAFCVGTTCGVSTWYDQQNATQINATQATFANMPSWNGINTVGGIRAVSFNNNAHALTGAAAPFNATTNKYLSIGLSLSWTPSSASLFVAAEQQDVGEPRGLFETTGGVGFLASYGYGTPALEGNGVLFGVMSDTGPTVTAITWNGTSATASVNNATSTVGANAQTAATGATIGNTHGFAATYDATAVILYPTLSTADAATVRLALQSRANIQPQSENVVLVVGDSMVSGEASATNFSIVRNAARQLNAPTRIVNAAVFGNVLSGIVSNLPSTKAASYVGTARNYVVVLHAFANDIRSSNSAATIWANMQSFVSTVKSWGSNVRVIIATCPVQVGMTGNGELQAINSQIIAGYNVPQSAGGLGADGIANFWADPTMGQDNYTSSAFSSGTNSPDGQHPLDTVTPYFAQVLAAAINAAIH